LVTALQQNPQLQEQIQQQLAANQAVQARAASLAANTLSPAPSPPVAATASPPLQAVSPPLQAVCICFKHSIVLQELGHLPCIDVFLKCISTNRNCRRVAWELQVIIESFENHTKILTSVDM